MKTSENKEVLEGARGAAPVESLRYLAGKSKVALNGIGIITVADLERVGVIDAYLQMKAAGVRAGLNFVWAMFAGLQGIDIFRIPAEFKEAVKAELKKADAEK